MKSLRYIDEFLELKSSPLIKDFFPNAKEITESFAAFNAIRQHFLKTKKLSYTDQNVSLFSVGDGNYPRTGALFAVRTKWNCFSIDPKMNIDKPLNINKLTIFKDKIENLKFNVDIAVIVGVHSHANLQATLNSITANKKYVMMMPCCVPMELSFSPLFEYRDDAVFSPENNIKIWEI